MTPPIGPRPRHGWRDACALLGLALFTGLYMCKRVQWHALPMEDALMLLRYSRHLAQGHGIRWNIGEPPVEGATDFLFMFSIGILSRLLRTGVIGIDRALLALTHLGSVLLLYLGARRLAAWPVWASCSLALYLSVGLATAYISTGFSAPFFAFFALAAWYVALRCIVSGPTATRGILLGGLLLVTSLTRPEGVLMSGFILLALLIALRRQAWGALLPALAILVPIGAAYFAWRFHYFGYLLPNPFYLKGGGRLHPEALALSVNYLCLMLAPALPLFALELFSANWRRAVIGLTPVVCFACIWILLSNENNEFMRFQYCALPLTLLSLPYASSTLRERLANRKFSLLAQGALCVLVLFFSVEYWTPYKSVYPTDTALYNIASALRPYKDKGYTIMTTEAGIVPYFSEWRAVDLYGLNDVSIAHSSVGATVEYLTQRMPAVILVHQPREGVANPGFKHADAAAASFVATHDYRLAAVWGYDACDWHLWYVRQGLPETRAFTEIVSRSPYFISGAPLPNLTGLPAPARCVDVQARVDLSQ